ncbi:hypothetical protein [Rugosimonospora africana]|uniref:Uncharacterized protein n=1 Tax=Rugosimonospora africana TaxID=556532 RepID=A0A8J3VT63_9ACTN|nr:hypothetical protein [Rugosimonospora africana]GIH17188.1 hypothetical protein Raf01_53600 [Rugosimonospora africana]
MSSATGDDAFLHELELNVRAELTLVEADQPTEEAVVVPSQEWLFDQADAERYDIGLRGLLDAVEALEEDSRSGVGPAPTGLDEASER